MAELRDILMSREALYAKAEAHINTSNASLEDSLKAVLQAVTAHGFAAS